MDVRTSLRIRIRYSVCFPQRSFYTSTVARKKATAIATLHSVATVPVELRPQPTSSVNAIVPDFCPCPPKSRPPTASPRYPRFISCVIMPSPITCILAGAGPIVGYSCRVD